MVESGRHSKILSLTLMFVMILYKNMVLIWFCSILLQFFPFSQLQLQTIAKAKKVTVLSGVFFNFISGNMIFQMSMSDERSVFWLCLRDTYPNRKWKYDLLEFIWLMMILKTIQLLFIFQHRTRGAEQFIRLNQLRASKFLFAMFVFCEPLHDRILSPVKTFQAYRLHFLGLFGIVWPSFI